MRHRVRRHLPGTVVSLILAAPALWIAGYSVLYSTGLTGLFGKGWTTEHWEAAIWSGTVLSSMTYSLIISAAVTVCSVGAAMLFVLFVPESRHSRQLTAVLCVPLATPSVVIAFLTYLILNPGGLLSRMSYHLGLAGSPSEFPELVNDPWAIGIVVAGFVSQFPILTLYLLKTWTTSGIDRYCSLAASLGASLWQSRWRVAAPMLLRRGRSLFLLCFLWTLGLFEIPLLLGVQHPMMYSVLIQKRSGQFNILQRPEAFVHATIYFVMLSAGLIVFLSWRRRDA